MKRQAHEEPPRSAGKMSIQHMPAKGKVARAREQRCCYMAIGEEEALLLWGGAIGMGRRRAQRKTARRTWALARAKALASKGWGTGRELGVKEMGQRACGVGGAFCCCCCAPCCWVVGNGTGERWWPCLWKSERFSPCGAAARKMLLLLLLLQRK